MFHWGLAAGQRISPSPSTMADGTWAELKTQSSCHLNVSQRWLLSFELLPITLWFVEALILIVRLASIWGYKKGRSIRTDIWALLLIAWKGVWVETVSNVSTVTNHNCTDSGSGWHHHNRMVARIRNITPPFLPRERKWRSAITSQYTVETTRSTEYPPPKHVVFLPFSCQIQPNSSNMTSKRISN